MRMFASFDEFVEERSTALLRTAFLLTGDRGHAEDLLQTTLLRTLRRWSKARAAPEAYARRVLVNLSKDRLRARGRQPRETALPPDGPDLPSVDAGYDRIADRGAVLDALAGLPPGQRQVVVLRFVEDLSVDQTADLLDCSAGTVKSQTARALTRLRELLADFHGSQHEKETTDVRR
jgi:RNA polymerase sigma-70 factor (sigma-E family)